MTSNQLKVMIDGQMVAAEDAKVSIFDHGFLFGDSVYEVVRTHKGQLFTWQEHIDRLFASAEGLALELPWGRDQLKQEAQRFIEACAFEGDVYVRLIITRGVGELNIDPSSCHQPCRIFIGKPLTRLPEAYYREGIKLSLVSTMRNPKRATNPGIKSGNYLNNVMALMEARKNKAQEAIMLNEHGWVTECSTSNLFLVQASKLRTPALDCGLLAGVTRGLVLDCAAKAGIEVEEGQFRAEDLWRAEELFITSTTRNIVPVQRIDEHRVPRCPGPLTKRLTEVFFEHCETRLG